MLRNAAPSHWPWSLNSSGRFPRVKRNKSKPSYDVTILRRGRYVKKLVVVDRL